MFIEAGVDYYMTSVHFLLANFRISLMARRSRTHLAKCVVNSRVITLLIVGLFFYLSERKVSGYFLDFSSHK